MTKALGSFSDLARGNSLPATMEPRFIAARASAADFLISFYVTSIILVIFILSGSGWDHWLIFPVFLCGVMIGTDLVLLVRGRLNPFSAEALVAGVGYHMFFLAPLLHVRWDQWMLWVVPPQDWRMWLGRFAILNVLGIGFYYFGKSWYRSRHAPSGYRPKLRLNVSRFYSLLIVLLVASSLLQIGIYATFGGVSGYVQAFETQPERFEGLGFLFILSESFPVLALLGYVVWAAQKKLTVSWSTIIVVLVTYFALRILFGGLRGSRGSIVWSMFWALGLIHFWIRPISRKAIVVACVSGIMFMYIFAFYKVIGSEFFDAIGSSETRTSIEEMTGRSMQSLILGDFSRADVQAFVLHQLSGDGLALRYDYLHGETYLATLNLFDPFGILPVEFASKADAGTYVLQAGSTSVLGSIQQETRVYGIAGEALLNFGWWAVPFAYGLFGIVVAAESQWQRSLWPGDSRFLLAPILTVLAFYPLVWDFDNVVVMGLQYALLPALLIYISSRPSDRPPPIAGHIRYDHLRHLE